jgi:hypothetical protein
MLPRPFRSCPFSFPIPHHPVRLSLIPLSVFPFSFFCRSGEFLPLYFMVGGTVATYRRVCQVANLGPAPEKFRSFLYLLLSSRPRVYRSLGKLLERTFSLFPFGLQPNKFASLSRPLPFFLDYSVSLLRVENS